MSLDDPFSGDLPRDASPQGLVTRSLAMLLPQPARGRLEIELPNGLLLRSGAAGPQTRLVMNRWRALRRLVLGGEAGFARAYVDGDWTTGDLAALLDLAMRNEESLARRTAPGFLARAAHRLAHYRNRNSLRGSRRNIMAHYDLGNHFYAAWLDRGMNYSSALYQGGATSLEAAQAAKLERAVKLLGAEPGDSVLEIGCGWGSLCELLARRQGCLVTGVTLSPAQLAHVRARLGDVIASGRADMRLQDYRDIGGKFDRIVSIEMIEAVGEAYWPGYFRILHDRLRPGGTALLQAITIAEDRFEAYRRRPDFIQRHIFPGGMLPTKTLIRQHAEAAGFKLVAEEAFGPSYARTLAEWRQRFHGVWPQLSAQGFDERFRRLWDYYLAYCETGFRFEAIDVGFFKLARP